MEARFIKRSRTNEEIIKVEVPYKKRFSILRSNKVYIPNEKNDKKTKFITQELNLNTPSFMVSDNDFFRLTAAKINEKKVVLSEKVEHIKTTVRIVNEYQLMKILEGLKQQKLQIMNITKYDEIIDNLKQNLKNSGCLECIIEKSKMINEELIVLIENQIQTINIEFIFPGEYKLEIKKLSLKENNNSMQKVKTR